MPKLPSSSLRPGLDWASNSNLLGEFFRKICKVVPKQPSNSRKFDLYWASNMPLPWRVSERNLWSHTRPSSSIEFDPDWASDTPPLRRV